MSLPKPRFCNEEWLDMKPTDDGRLCGQCQKNIFDLTKHSWKEIEELQAENNNSLCGMYHPKQLKYWGQEVPKTNFVHKSVLAASLVFGLGTLSSQESYAQIADNSPLIQDSLSNSKVNSPLQDTIPQVVLEGEVRTIIKGNQKIEKLPYVNVVLKNAEHKVVKGVTTDLDGNFRMVLDMELDTLKKYALEISYIGYGTKRIPLSELTNTTLYLTVDLKESVELMNTFYLEKPSKMKKIGRGIKNVFKKKE